MADALEIRRAKAAGRLVGTFPEQQGTAGRSIRSISDPGQSLLEEMRLAAICRRQPFGAASRAPKPIITPRKAQVATVARPGQRSDSQWGVTRLPKGPEAHSGVPQSLISMPVGELA